MRGSCGVPAVYLWCGRTDNAIKNRWNSFFRRRVEQLQQQMEQAHQQQQQEQQQTQPQLTPEQQEQQKVQQQQLQLQQQQLQQMQRQREEEEAGKARHSPEKSPELTEEQLEEQRQRRLQIQAQAAAMVPLPHETEARAKQLQMMMQTPVNYRALESRRRAAAEKRKKLVKGRKAGQGSAQAPEHPLAQVPTPSNAPKSWQVENAATPTSDAAHLQHQQHQHQPLGLGQHQPLGTGQRMAPSQQHLLQGPQAGTPLPDTGRSFGTPLGQPGAGGARQPYSPAPQQQPQPPQQHYQQHHQPQPQSQQQLHVPQSLLQVPPLQASTEGGLNQQQAPTARALLSRGAQPRNGWAAAPASTAVPAPVAQRPGGEGMAVGPNWPTASLPGRGDPLTQLVQGQSPSLQTQGAPTDRPGIEGSFGSTPGAPLVRPGSSLKPMQPIPVREQQMSAAGSEAPRAADGAPVGPATPGWHFVGTEDSGPAAAQQRQGAQAEVYQGYADAGSTAGACEEVPPPLWKVEEVLELGADGTQLLLELAEHAVADFGLASSALLPPVFATMGALGHAKVAGKAQAGPDLAARPAVKEAGEGEGGKEPESPQGAEVAQDGKDTGEGAEAGGGKREGHGEGKEKVEVREKDVAPPLTPKESTEGRASAAARELSSAEKGPLESVPRAEKGGREAQVGEEEAEAEGQEADVGMEGKDAEKEKEEEKGAEEGTAGAGAWRGEPGEGQGSDRRDVTRREGAPEGKVPTSEAREGPTEAGEEAVGTPGTPSEPSAVAQAYLERGCLFYETPQLEDAAKELLRLQGMHLGTALGPAEGPAGAPAVLLAVGAAAGLTAGPAVGPAGGPTLAPAVGPGVAISGVAATGAPKRSLGPSLDHWHLSGGTNGGPSGASQDSLSPPRAYPTQISTDSPGNEVSRESLAQAIRVLFTRREQSLSPAMFVDMLAEHGASGFPTGEFASHCLEWTVPCSLPLVSTCYSREMQPEHSPEMQPEHSP